MTIYILYIQYTALTYSFPNFEPVHCFMSGSYCCFLIYIQISQEAGKVVWYAYLFKNFPLFVMIHRFKGLVNEAEIDDFLEFPCFFYDSMDVGNFISDSPAYSKPRFFIWKFLVHILLKPDLHDFKCDLASM